MRSGKEIGAEHVNKLKAYLESIDALPARRGKINVTAVAEAVGVDRQTLYKHPTARQLLEEAIASKGLRGLATRDGQIDTTITKLERQVSDLEKKNSALMAENWELRRELARLRRVEELMEQGRRVTA